MNENRIDIVLPWVDSYDPEWQSQKNKYAEMEGHKELIDESESRFRDWDTVRFLLRGIDQYMPWVHTVHFVTCGHIPHWMNPKAKRLHIVNHREYIPSEFLPTFSSHTIELNMHRIRELSEQFIYFNDDILVLKPFKPNHFFKDNMPRDYAILNPLISSHRYSVADIALMDIEIINDHFDKNTCIIKHMGKWVNYKYGGALLRSLCMMPWPKFSTLLTKHQCNAYLKSEFQEVWEAEPEILTSTCSHRFRTNRDVNQWLIRYWRLAKGRFIPIRPYGALFGLKNDNSKLYKAIISGKDGFICINDTTLSSIRDFETSKRSLINILEKRFPHKSSFER